MRGGLKILEQKNPTNLQLVGFRLLMDWLGMKGLRLAPVVFFKRL